MSYTSSYAVFDKVVADTKLKEMGSEQMKHVALTYNPEEFVYFYTELGSMIWFQVEDPYMVEQLASIHDIPYEDHFSQENLFLLFERIDSKKIEALINADEDIVRRIEDATLEMRNVIAQFVAIEADGASTETTYSIENVQRYAVPLFNTHGFIVYTKVTKQEIIDLLNTLSDAKIQEAVTRASFVEEAQKLVRESVLETLQGLRRIVQGLKDHPHAQLLFTDDGDIFPKTLVEEVNVIFEVLQKESGV